MPRVNKTSGPAQHVDAPTAANTAATNDRFEVVTGKFGNADSFINWMKARINSVPWYGVKWDYIESGPDLL